MPFVSPDPADPFMPRKGAVRRSAVPALIVDALNRGLTQTVNLVEFLVVDQVALLRHVAGELGLDANAPALDAAVEEARQLGVMKKQEAIGAGLYHSTSTVAGRRKLLTKLMAHRSDTVRNWACVFVGQDASLALKERLAVMRPLAADGHGGVREMAWVSVRPFIVDEINKAFQLLGPWARDADENIRRFAIELTRPRGVWCAHLESLKTDPTPGVPLLEHVRSDPSDYVRRSCANWLNDASKSRPDWVINVCRRWAKESRSDETRWIIHHATRTIRKNKS